MESRNILADNYFKLIKNESSDVKLALINRIKESIKTVSLKKDDSWKSLFGAFQSEKTADEIIDELRNSRYTNRKIEKL